MEKYKLRHDEKASAKYGMTLYRIIATRDFGNVKAGDVGGLVSSEDSLSNKGSCWVYHDAAMLENAKVRNNAVIKDSAIICGNVAVQDRAVVEGAARIYNCAVISDFAKVSGDATVSGKAQVCGDTVIESSAKVTGNVKVETGTVTNCIVGSDLNRKLRSLLVRIQWYLKQKVQKG